MDTPATSTLRRFTLVKTAAYDLLKLLSHSYNQLTQRKISARAAQQALDFAPRAGSSTSLVSMWIIAARPCSISAPVTVTCVCVIGQDQRGPGHRRGS